MQAHFPITKQNIMEKMVDMTAFWQFPCCWGAVDGCHIPIQCPPGGLKACKEYHNFKNFYSIVLMAIVDAQDRFIWASVGFPGNSHDSIIFQSTDLWHNITENNIIPSISQVIEGTEVYLNRTFRLNTYTFTTRFTRILRLSLIITARK